MISLGKSNSSIMHSGMAPPQGLQLSILRSIMKVSMPALAHSSAAQAPAGPPPTIATLGGLCECGLRVKVISWLLREGGHDFLLPWQQQAWEFVLVLAEGSLHRGGDVHNVRLSGLEQRAVVFGES